MSFLVPSRFNLLVRVSLGMLSVLDACGMGNRRYLFPQCGILVQSPSFRAMYRSPSFNWRVLEIICSSVLSVILNFWSSTRTGLASMDAVVTVSIPCLISRRCSLARAIPVPIAKRTACQTSCVRGRRDRDLFHPVSCRWAGEVGFPCCAFVKLATQSPLDTWCDMRRLPGVFFELIKLPAEVFIANARYSSHLSTARLVLQWRL